MLEWLNEHESLMWTMGAASIVMFVGSLFLMPAIIVRIRHDYFAHDRRPPPLWAHRHAAIRVLLHILKNLLGGLLILAGLAMLVLPGQGLLTLILGFFLIDFPGKYRFERWLVARPYVHRPLNWLRRRAQRAPLQLHVSLVSARASD